MWRSVDIVTLSKAYVVNSVTILLMFHGVYDRIPSSSLFGQYCFPTITKMTLLQVYHDIFLYIRTMQHVPETRPVKV